MNPIDSVLATRGQLRGRKDELEKQAKVPRREILGKAAINVTDINRRLGINLSCDFVEFTLEMPPCYVSGTTRLWYEHEFPYLCHELSQYFFGLQHESSNED